MLRVLQLCYILFQKQSTKKPEKSTYTLKMVVLKGSGGSRGILADIKRFSLIQHMLAEYLQVVLQSTAVSGTVKQDKQWSPLVQEKVKINRQIILKV